MESRFRIAGHPAHPMLVMFPTALLPLLILLDVLHLWTGDAGAWTVGFWVALAGLVMTALAIVPGIVDMAAIPNETRAHRTALFHFVVGMTILATYAAAVWVRWPAGSAPDRFGLAFAVDIIGTLLVTAQGWLGAELVYRHHVGVKTVAEGGDPVALAAKGDDAAREKRVRRPS
ncbi:MAG TPA: DUF2231 domain-containing protein [Candidatus Thermoplasmatota archaeon]|nr:DUF2231 domain-containing protein [Candidatus Thermoplasmatota archaeon]